jgi:hypothetical protein
MGKKPSGSKDPRLFQTQGKTKSTKNTYSAFAERDKLQTMMDLRVIPTNWLKKIEIFLFTAQEAQAKVMILKEVEDQCKVVIAELLL